MFRGTARYMANERPLAAYRFGPAVVSFGSPAAVRALWKQPLGCRRVHAMWPVAALAALAAKVGYDVLAPGLPGCCLTEVPGPGWRALRRPGGAGGGPSARAGGGRCPATDAGGGKHGRPARVHLACPVAQVLLQGASRNGPVQGRAPARRPRATHSGRGAKRRTPGRRADCVRARRPAADLGAAAAVVAVVGVDAGGTSRLPRRASRPGVGEPPACRRAHA